MLLLLLCAILGTTGHVSGFAQDNFLLYAETGNLHQLSLAPQRSMWKIPVGYQEGIYTLAFDPVEMKVYWIEFNTGRLKRAYINGTGREDVYETYGNSNIRPFILAIDAISRLVYFTQSNHRDIAVVTLDGRHSFTVLSGLSDGVLSMALYPARGMLYWSEGRGMMAAGMDGFDLTILDRRVHNIWGLTVDSIGDRLFWISGDNIQAMSIQGRNKRTVMKSVIGYGLAVLGQNLYYTMVSKSTRQRYIVKLNITTSTSSYQIVSPPVSDTPKAITAYSHMYEDDGKSNECSQLNGGCEHICVPTPRGRRCACWGGFNAVGETKCFITTYTCPLEYNATRGLIQNPGYPGYRNNMRCQIIIHLQKPGQAIFLKVGHFDLENNNDYLQINYERWSGSRNSRYNYAYTVHSRNTYWRFITDGKITKRGFSITYEIHDVTHCSSSSPCRNGGTCVTSDFCVCPVNYTGDRCELVDDDPCRSLPCQNGGQCKSLSSGYTCDCRPGTTGRQCEIEKPCASVTCHNGGTCKHTKVGAWCECQPGFTGQMCDTEINICGSNPCQNSGTCKQAFGQYACDCVAGYHGIKCEIVDDDPCRSLPCQNSGQCKSLSSGYTCDCRPGTTGRQCETDIDECSSSPCENNAMCSTTQADVYLCKCTPRYTGYNCETVVETEQRSDASGSATLIMVTPVTASVVVLVIVGIVLCLIWRRRRLSARPDNSAEMSACGMQQSDKEMSDKRQSSHAAVYHNSQHDQLNRGRSPGDLSTQQASLETYYEEVDQIEEPQHSYANFADGDEDGYLKAK